MKVLDSLNQIKEQLQEIKNVATERFPDDLLPGFMKSMDTLQDQLNNSAAIVEEYFQSKMSKMSLTKDLMQRMKDYEIYSALSENQKQDIAERVVENPDLDFLDEEGFRSYITKLLRDLDSNELVMQAYSKEDIVKLGQPFAPKGAGTGLKYDSGLNMLTELAQTPSGFEEAVQYGLERVLNNPTLTKKYLLSYYRV